MPFMMRFIGRSIAGLLLSVLVGTAAAGAGAPVRIGLIGLDSSHAVHFSRIFNDVEARDHIPGARVVCAFKGGSADMELSRSRVDGFTEQVRTKYGVAILPSIADVVVQSDALMILSVDGRVHLEQAREAFVSGKPVFIDKPLAGSLEDAIEIVRLSRREGVPLFSTSSLRYSPGMPDLLAPGLGRIRGAFSYGPAQIEPTVPDLYYYGIHAVEVLYAVLGPGCVSVVRTYSDDTDVVTGIWGDGRTGVVYGLRNGKNAFRVTVFGESEIRHQVEGHDYGRLLRDVLAFFRTGNPPVPVEETLEILAFMEAADESRRRGGVPVALACPVEKAREPERAP